MCLGVVAVLLYDPCDPSVHLSVPSICFVCVFVCLRTGSQVFPLFMLFLWAILHTVHLALWYVVLVCHQYDVCKNYVGSVCAGVDGSLSESGRCVFRELCSVTFL